VTRVLVTGGGGFIGLPLLARMADAQEIHALCTRARPPEPDGVRWHVLDLTDGRALESLIEELAPERLVHLAWCTEHGRFWHAGENLVWVERSLRLLRAFARHGGRRALILGTCAEYDWSSAGGPLAEVGSPLVPSSLYGVAKDSLRRVAVAYAEQEGFELAWGRLFHLYGPREDPRRLVPSIACPLLAGEPVATRHRAQIRDFMHVEDVADAIAALLDSSVVGEVNIASGVGVAVAEVVDRIVELTGGSELIHRGVLASRPGEPRQLLADVTRLREEVGFAPRWNLSDGLAETVAWWRQRERRVIPVAAL
jgi:nucleoside-diphosphate-sugar epimerase